MSFTTQAQYSYRHYTLRDGLAQGSSNYIMQDSRRFLWMSIQGGINRFDGSRFVFYANGKKGLRGGFASGLIEAPDGDLWIGTEIGLNRYNRKTDTFTAILPAGHKATATHVFDVDSAAVWFVSDALGLVRYNYHTNQYTVLLPGLTTSKSLENDYVFHDRAAHQIWFVLPKGLLVVDYNSHHQHTYFSDDIGDPMHRPTCFTAIRWDAARRVFWLADKEGILAFSPQTKTYTFYKSPVDQETYPAYDIHIDARQQLWINTGGAGIMVFDSRRREFTEHLRHQPQNPQSLAIDEVGSLYIDREGTIWANVDPLGIDRITPDQGGIRTYTANSFEKQPLVADAVRGITEAPDGSIWIGSISGGASRLDPTSGQIRRYIATSKPGSLPDGAISGFCVDKQGRTWLATRQGLAEYSPATDQFRLYRPSDTNTQASWVKGIFAEEGNSLLVATYAGLFRYMIDKRRFVEVGKLSDRLVGSFWHDTLNHRLYIGRWQAGFDVYEYRNGRLKWVYNEPLNGQNALCFHYDTTRRTLWVGSSELVAYDVTNQRIVRRIALGDEVWPIYAIVPDSPTNWWVPTNQGLFRYNPETGLANLFRAVRPQEYNSLAALKTRRGLLFFGGNEGVVSINPKKLTSRFNPVTVALSSILINDRPTALAANELDTVRLPANQRTLTVHYGAVDFVSEGKNQYKYKLLSYDPAWIDAGNSMVARYANLPPGTYMFDVKAANANGQWTARPRRLVVLVGKPFWQEIWFILLVGIIGSIVLYGVFRWLLARRLRSQRARFNLILKSQQDERARLARELHDHIGPDLAVLKLKLELATDEAMVASEAQQLAKFSADLGHILGDLRNVSHALLPADLQAHSLVDSLQSFIGKLSNIPDRPEVSFVHNIVGSIPQLLQQPIYQIVKELVYNALKHANASLIDVELNQQNGNLSLTVTDDGRGYDPVVARSQSSGIGLRNLEAIVAMLNGELIIHPRPLRGTVHRVRLPA
ncbi:triple tyrosine motif-containing protein [uncultured Fibrella sp.]|uniref:ligand-binding sensor domain-containing protein n=1 Tax=uncultured Fibrella sp. TaxID=1284596 RepID=UPI0035CC00AA